jgi:hypothetical protein
MRWAAREFLIILLKMIGGIIVFMAVGYWFARSNGFKPDPTAVLVAAAVTIIYAIVVSIPSILSLMRRLQG